MANTDAANSPSPSLLSNTLYAVGGMAFFHLCQLGIVVTLNKLTTAEVCGEYFFALAIAQPVMLLLSLELRAAFVSDTHNRFTLGTYLALRWFAVVLGVAVLTGFLVQRIATSDGGATWLITAGVFAARIAWSAAEIGWGTYQRRERLDLLAVSNMLRGVASILPFIVVLPLLVKALSVDPVAAAALTIWLYAGGWAVVHIAYDRPRVADRSRWELSWSGTSVRALAWQTLPLGLVALVINLCDSVPRWIFDSALVPDGKRQLGYFGSLAYITFAGNLMMIQIATASASRLAVYYRTDIQKFRRLVLRLVGVAIAIGGAVLLLATFAGRTILTWLYTAEYGAFKPQFQLIVLGHCLALVTNVLGVATTQMRLFWVQVPAQVITLAATLVAAFLLIPGDRPVQGAAMAAFVRAIAQFLVYVPCFFVGLALRSRMLASRSPETRRVDSLTQADALRDKQS